MRLGRDSRPPPSPFCRPTHPWLLRITPHSRSSCFPVSGCLCFFEDQFERASAAENWTAVSQLMKTRAGILGMLRDHVVLSFEQQMSDQELVERLSRGDAEKAAVYRKLL